MKMAVAPRRQGLAFSRSDAGAAGIEFAFIVPVLLAAIFAVVEVSRVMYAKVEFEYAVFSATRLSAVTKSADTANVQKALQDNFILLNAANLSPVTVTVKSNGDTTSTATLTASYAVNTLLPFVNFKTVTLSKTVSFLIPG